jgi:hypothetical protein
MRGSWRWDLIAIGAAAVLAVGACSGDDDASGNDTGAEADTPADQSETDVAAFCDAIDDMGLSVSIGEGYEGIDDALVAAEELAPDEISAEVTTMADESRAQVAAGPPPSGQPPSIAPNEFFAAATSVGDYMADHCGYPVLDVTATDHAFDGVPASTEADKTLVRITNEGTEYHEVVVERVQPGETRSLEEIVALPQQEEGDLLDYVGSALAPPGLGSWTVVELSAGRHAALCFIPVGATTPELAAATTDDTTPRHTTQGMFAELEVT